MIIVHHLNNSRSQRILWLLEELGLDYEIKHYQRDPQTMLAPPELARIHPLGKFPVIDDNGVIVAETGAIIEYLVDKAGGQLGPPQAHDEALRYRHFLHYAEGSLMPPLFAMLVLARIGPTAAPGLEAVHRMLAGHFDWLEAELGDRPWFAGPEFTSADVMMSFPLEAGAARAGALDGRPRLAAWLETIHDRPAYGRALERGGPYAYASVEERSPAPRTAEDSRV